jgi:hypothetical protein
MPNFYADVTSLQDISGIVANESTRLDDKKKNIDQAYDNQQRIILLNQSYGQRMQQYTFISILLAITFMVIIFLLYLQKEFPIIPHSVYDLIMIILIGSVGIYVFQIYNGILSRDKLDFSKISPDSPALLSADELKKQQDAAVAAGKISNAIDDPNKSGTCVGSGCCPDGKSFNTSLNKCDAFSTLEQAYGKNEIIKR